MDRKLTRLEGIWGRLPLALTTFALAVLGDGLFAQTLVKPEQYLASQPKPVFAPSYRLPVLTKCGWPLSSNLNVMTAQYFGYALDFGEINHNYNPLDNLNKPGTFEYGMVQLAKNDPTHFKLSVHTDRQLNETVPIPTGYWCTNSSGFFVDNTTNWQVFTNPPPGHYAIPSPEAPDSYWQAVSDIWGRELATLRSNCPIAIILNDGEYGMQEYGGNATAWKQDPRVMAKAGTNTLNDWWATYSATQKSHQQGMQTVAFRQAVPDRQLYIFYGTGAERTRNSNQGSGWSPIWGFDSRIFVTNSDLPSFECYYQGWAGYDYTNENPTGSLLTEYLNSVGFNIALGYTNNYSWVCGGWTSKTNNDPKTNPALSDIALYTGFLKCLYTGGMIGGNAGYYTYPAGGFDVAFPTNNPPHWLQQIQALGHVHALFSHLEAFLYNGDLLSGPQPHRYSVDQPAYEFTNSLADATARVMARKLRTKDQWMVTAWAADGLDRNVTVSIPVLGTVQILARASGAVYLATTNKLTLLDVNGTLPTASFAGMLAPATDLQVLPLPGQ